MSATGFLAHPRAAYAPAFAALAAGLLALGLVFWPEAQAAYRVWNESTAYGHCFLVLPIALYLIWDRRDSLRGLLPQATPAAALLAIPLPFAWLAADRLGLMEGRQLVAVAMMEVLFLGVLGPRLFRAVSGPLLYLFFLVPFGAFLTGALQSFTAWFIEAGLNVLGIPHFVNDMIIEISAGTFFVAEACAGLRFLIASIAFGVFFALLNYNSPGRRAGFIAASIIVPIIANGFRALGIVVLGHILGSAQAAAADHLIYGWFFFSFVTLLLVAAGLPFREAPLGAPVVADGPNRTYGFAFARTALAVLLLAAIGPAAALALDRNAAPARLAGTPRLAAPDGCQIVPGTPQPGQLAWVMTCNARSWTIALQALAPRSTGAAIGDARRTLVGVIDAEDVTNAGLPGAPGWQVTMTRNPALLVGIAVWIDGQPARGGLRQRLAMARDSLLGATHAPLVMAASYRGTPDTAPASLADATAELTRFVEANPGLDAELAATAAQPR